MSADRLTTTEAFRPLSEDALEALRSRGTVRRLTDGEALFRVGDADRDFLYILHQGRIALSDPTGAVTTYDSVTLMGLSSYFDDEPYAETAISVGDCEIIEVPFPAVRELELAHPALADTLSQIIVERIRTGPAKPRSNLNEGLSRPVRNFMTTPVARLGGRESLGDAFRLMEQRRIGSLAIVDDQGHLVGLATARGVARAAIADGLKADAPVSNAAEAAVCITPDIPLWQAEEIQARQRVKYLLVMEGAHPVGMLSQTDIIDAIRTQRTVMRDRVERAASIQELRALTSGITGIADDARTSHREASRAVHVLSEYHLRLQRRCVELTLEELEQEGLGQAPRGFALLVLGSLARRESLLNPDQDNAIIIADSRPGETASLPLDAAEGHWFETFTDRLNHRLDDIGYAWCKGDIMARTPDYRRRLEEWRKQVRHMARHPNPTAARWCNIVLDFELLYGDDRLVETLWREILGELVQRNRLLRFMAGDDAQGQPALGLFNRLVTSDQDDAKGRVDIKRNGLRIIANGARILSLAAGIRETNTVSRLRALRREGVLTADKTDSVIAAQDRLLDLLLSHQITRDRHGLEPDKYIDPRQLHELDKQSLTSSMRAIRRFQDRVQGLYGL